MLSFGKGHFQDPTIFELPPLAGRKGGKYEKELVRNRLGHFFSRTVPWRLPTSGSGDPDITIDRQDALDTNGTYTTQTRLSALEYSIFMNKQLNVFINQLSTHMGMAYNSDNYSYDALLPSAEQSLTSMQEAYDEVMVTYPAQGNDDERLTALTQMSTAISHMEEYISYIKQGKDISDFSQYFENDFLALTSTATMYNQ